MTAKDVALALDGKALAARREQQLVARVAALCQRAPRPVLAAVLVGDDPASQTYVRMKEEACQRVGIEPRTLRLPTATSTESLLAQIEALNEDDEVRGILLQHPVPAGIDERRCFDAIALDKDVDGVSCHGYGRMAMACPAWGSATPTGIMQLLAHYNIELTGRHAVVLGRSPILGKPMAMMLLNKNATVTICHSRTRDLPEQARQADVLVAAVGQPRFVQSDWIKPGAVVIDAGYHPAERCGDVAAEQLPEIASAYTPVPGGVGPMTINTLLDQTVAAAERYAEECMA